MKRVAISLLIMCRAFYMYAAEIDYSIYQKILHNSVTQGKVNYLYLVENQDDLEHFLKQIADINIEELDQMPKEAQLSFYINAYNAYTLLLIVQHYPIKSIKDIDGAWSKKYFLIAQKQMTLDDIEHNIIRKIFKEPRIHFALVCASKGCPPLLKIPYIADDLDVLLEQQTYQFINNLSKNRYDAKKNTLYLSPIFKWFKSDFKEVRIFLSKYLPKEVAKRVLSDNPKIRYTDYDWSLNEG